MSQHTGGVAPTQEYGAYTPACQYRHSSGELCGAAKNDNSAHGCGAHEFTDVSVESCVNATADSQECKPLAPAEADASREDNVSEPTKLVEHTGEGQDNVSGFAEQPCSPQPGAAELRTSSGAEADTSPAPETDMESTLRCYKSAEREVLALRREIAALKSRNGDLYRELNALSGASSLEHTRHTCDGFHRDDDTTCKGQRSNVAIQHTGEGQVTDTFVNDALEVFISTPGVWPAMKATLVWALSAASQDVSRTTSSEPTVNGRELATEEAGVSDSRGTEGDTSPASSLEHTGEGQVTDAQVLQAASRVTLSARETLGGATRKVFGLRCSRHD